MSYADGISLYPGAIDQRVTHTQGDQITPENQTFILDGFINVQETLGVNPQDGSGTVANRLATGTFPTLNIGGTATIAGETTITNGDLIVGNTVRPDVILRDTGQAAPFDIAGRITFQDQGGTEHILLRKSSSSNDFVLDNQITNGQIIFVTQGAGYVRIGSPTQQASPAQGDLNAVRLFSNGTLVTCYPFETAYGRFDQAEWDALVPDDAQYDADGNLIGTTPREHEPAKRFATRNDLDIASWCASIRARKALPNFPTKEEAPITGKMELGDVCQRLLEQLEVQAVHIEQLHRRLAALEPGC